MYDFIFSQVVVGREFEIMNNGYYIEGCAYAHLYYSKKFKAFAEVGYNANNQIVSLRIVERDVYNG